MGIVIFILLSLLLVFIGQKHFAKSIKNMLKLVLALKKAVKKDEDSTEKKGGYDLFYKWMERQLRGAIVSIIMITIGIICLSKVVSFIASMCFSFI